MAGVIPECRYGHGPLEQPTADVDITWSLRGISKMKDEDGIVKAFSASRTYTVRLYQCRECGYIELFNDEL